ncbi:MAG: uroporphyrin-III C-methyltransferase / precorrin-2 dehydrogenase / sirohydrochlorin ferrochelatase [Actinomycetota bacterium]|nr:uroporphyrin-III C-methyltransferase / precorrin-2 dehydrogenase / sirohydrochlorin ferrochelatase [Actinomycetota bacterium]
MIRPLPVTEAGTYGAPYLAGLRLQGRRVVVVGGGSVALRRIPALLEAGAEVQVISPEISAALGAMASAGQVAWFRRRFAPGDLARAWYALAATDDAEVNAAVAAEAEDLRVFCVRADDAEGATAVTPASGTRGDVRVGVLTGVVTRSFSAPALRRDPRRAARIRDHLVQALSTEVTHPAERVSAEGGNGAGPGSVTLVGGGPGAPDLITVRGKEALSRADVVVTDRLAPLELLSDLPETTVVVDASKLPRGHFMAQEAINDHLVRYALEGYAVVRLKGGDPFLFGRGSEEVAACTAAGVPVTVVPGVCSALSVPGLAGIPLTERGVAHEVTIVSGHLPPGHPRSLVDWSALGRLKGTVAVLMGVENLPAIARELMASGRSAHTPVAVVCDGSLPSSRTVPGTLGTIAEIAVLAQVVPPAVVVIGPVAGRMVDAGQMVDAGRMVVAGRRAADTPPTGR